MGSGRISNLLIELAGLDIAEALRFVLGRDKKVTLRCAWVQADLTDGVVDIKSAAFDTTDTVVYLEGNSSLADESLALRVVPQPKDMSPVAVRTPIRIAGTYKDPTARPEVGPLVLRGAAAVALYAIVPPAALLALIETGPGADTDCKAKGGKGGKGGQKADGQARGRQDRRGDAAAKAGGASANDGADKAAGKAAGKAGNGASGKAADKAADAREARK
jgi:hypothetical protein